MTDFFTPGEASDERYRILRDDDLPIVSEGRRFVEQIWRDCAAYVDADLAARARDTFQPRFWELYVAHTLLSRGPGLISRDKRAVRVKGPDLLLSDGTTWVEAVLPTAGVGQDRVVPPEPGTASWVPHDALKLRLLNAINEKLQKYDRYRTANILKPGDRYIIAVGGSALAATRLEGTVPRIVSSVLPFGPEQVHIDTKTLDVVGRTFAFQPSVTKKSGAVVATTLFQLPISAPISALIYAWADEINRPVAAGDEFVIVHNPLASNPLPHGYFPFGTEYWFEDGQLHWKASELGVGSESEPPSEH